MTGTDANLPVREFMTGDLCTVDADLSLSDAMERMAMNRIRHLAVTTNGAIVGVVSNRDLGLAEGVLGVDSAKTPVSVAVIGPAHTVDANSPVHEVAAVMEAHRYGCVVVTDNDAPVGIFTTTDALRVLRQVVTGKPAERLSPPTHVLAHDDGDARHASRASSRESLRGHRASPSPNDGKFGRGPV